MKFDVVTFGAAVVDVFVKTDLPEKNKSISYPTGSKILIKELKEDIGGGATNTATAFSRLGLKTGCICKISDDESGNEILSLLKKEKISFLGKIQKQKKSGYSVILDSKEHNRTILTYKGINNQISQKDSPKIKTKYLYISSLLGKSFKTQIQLAKKLKQQGTKIAFNPSEYQIKKLNLSPLLKLTDILIFNKQEAQILTKSKPTEKTKTLLNKIHKLGPEIVVITDKNKPIQASDSKKIYKLKPNKVKVVERAGAGDAFASGFVAGILTKRSIPQALKLGLKESEAVIKHVGTKNNLIRMKLK